MSSQLEDRTPWNDVDLSILRQLIGMELPMTYIAQRLHRSASAVRRKAQTVAIGDMLHCPAVARGPGPLRRRQT